MLPPPITASNTASTFRSPRLTRRRLLQALGYASALGAVGLASAAYGTPAQAAALSTLPDSAVLPAAPAGQPMFQQDAQHTGRSPYAGPRQVTLLRSFDMAFPDGPPTAGTPRPRVNVQSSAAIAPDGTIYIANLQGNLFALRDAGSGDSLSLLWHFHPNGQSSLHGTPAIGQDGNVYLAFGTTGAGSPKGTLYALAAPSSGTTPRTAWSVDLGPGRPSFSPTLGADGTIYALSGEGRLFAVAPNGTVKWTAMTGPILITSPALASDGTVYVASTNGTLYAVAPPSAGSSAGSVQWTFDFSKQLGPTPLVTAKPPPPGADGIGTFASPTLGPDGTIYLGASNSNVYAVAPSGQLKWLYEAEREIAGIASTAALSADGQTLYFGANKGGIYAVNTADGTLRWRFNIFGSVFSSPTLDSGGTLYTGSSVGHVFALDTSTGQPVFDHDVGSPVWSAPAIRPDASLVIVTTTGHVHLFAPGPTSLPTTGGGGMAGQPVPDLLNAP